MRKISLIIPTLNASCELPRVLESIETQSIAVDEIIVVDSESDDDTVSIAKSYPRTKVISILRKDFDHGKTRHMAFLETVGEYVLFLTQDAVPLGCDYVASLLKPFEDERVALVSGRQRPKSDARRFEQLVREFNYPPESNTRSIKDLPVLGIKTYFASDACSAYRKAAYLECGGFAQPCNTNEDMLMAATFINRGWKIAYAAGAEVAHSHNLSLVEQYRRNKEVGYFLGNHEDELKCGSEIAEGSRLVKKISSTLLKERSYAEIFAFGLDCAARMLGNRRGRQMAKREKQ